VFADEALERFAALADVRSVLDIGSGAGEQAAFLRARGKLVTTVSLGRADVVADYLTTNLGPVDGIWASHVLEHMPNVGAFLGKCFSDLRDDGVLAVTVPPAKHEIVGGHVSLWNAGLLLYRLVLAGFDCRAARVGTYGYNVSVIVRKVPAVLPALAMDAGDIERLAEFFPVAVAQGFDGELPNIGWN
jgi:SAM-dependent methyltransferase